MKENFLIKVLEFIVWKQNSINLIKTNSIDKVKPYQFFYAFVTYYCIINERKVLYVIGGALFYVIVCLY